jgi:hypothetical protein
MNRALTRAVVALACLSAAAVAPPVGAAELDPVLAVAMLRPSDLSPAYGRATKVWNNDLGAGVIPTSCTSGPAGAWAEGKVADRTYFKEIDYAKGKRMWQDTIYLYSTAAQARATYVELLVGAKKYCSSTFQTTIGDAGESIPVTQTNVTTVLSKASGMRRFAVGTNTGLQDPASANATYHDSSGYGVFLLDGSSIHQVQVYQDSVITPLERKNAAKAAVSVATRFSSLP